MINKIKLKIQMNLLYFFLLFITTILCYENNLEENPKETPQILTGNVNLTAYIGDTVTLPCEVLNLGSYHVNWLKIKNGTPNTLTVGYQQFSRNLRYRVARFHEQSQLKNKIESWNFEIRRVEEDDQGLYECYIRPNSKHKIKANIRLIVKSEKEKPEASKYDSMHLYNNNAIIDNPRSERLSSFFVEKIDLTPNSHVKLRCNTSAPHTHSTRSEFSRSVTGEIQWYKDDKLIEHDLRRLKKWVSSYDNSNFMELELYAVDTDDSGVYQCRRDKTILKNIHLKVLQNNAISLTNSEYFLILSILSFKLLNAF